MNDVLINRNIVSGISQPFEVGDEQVTVYAYNLQPNERVFFELVALSELIKGTCGNCPPAVMLPQVVDAMPLKCCDDTIYLTRDRPWVILDAPQAAKLRAVLETDVGAIVTPTDQLVVYNKTTTRNVNDRMRGCACAGAA